MATPLPISIFFPVLIASCDTDRRYFMPERRCHYARNPWRNRAHAIRYGDAGSKVPAEPNHRPIIRAGGEPQTSECLDTTERKPATACVDNRLNYSWSGAEIEEMSGCEVWKLNIPALLSS